MLLIKNNKNIMRSVTSTLGVKNKKEHILAFKIAILLFIFAFIISSFIFSFNHILDGNISGQHDLQGLGKKGNFNYNRYIIFGILSVIIYFVSYFLAKFTIKPIEENNERLKEYNHNVAHELKTPLSVIKSDLELMEMGKKFDLELIKSSKQEIVIAQNIIDSLLFLSQKKENLKLEKMNLFNILEKNILEKYDKNLFKINCENKNNCDILAEKKLIEILLKNLIENAVKYGEKTEKVEIDLEKNSLIIKNKIDKNISKIDTERLFEAFYQADNSRNTSGYGLGLNIVKKIVDLHNFKIFIEIKNNFFIVKIVF